MVKIIISVVLLLLGIVLLFSNISQNKPQKEDFLGRSIQVQQYVIGVFLIIISIILLITSKKYF